MQLQGVSMAYPSISPTNIDDSLDVALFFARGKRETQQTAAVAFDFMASGKKILQGGTLRAVSSQHVRLDLRQVRPCVLPSRLYVHTRQSIILSSISSGKLKIASV